MTFVGSSHEPSMNQCAALRISHRMRNSNSEYLDMSIEQNTNCQMMSQLRTYYGDTGSFQLRMWNVDTIRMNKAIEGWHHILNCDIGRSHPNIHKLVDVLRKEQASTETTIQQALLGVAPPPRRRRYRELDCRLQRVRLSYELGVYTTEAYMTAIQHIITTEQNCVDWSHLMLSSLVLRISGALRCYEMDKL